MLKTARAAFAALILACAMVLAGPLTAAAPTASLKTSVSRPSG